jgi:hypothetical protein
MSEGDIPSRFGPATKWVLTGIILFILGLGVSDSLHEGDWSAAAIYAALFVAVFVVAVKWDKIAAFLARWRQKVAWTLVLMGFVGALALGVAIGGLLLRGGPLAGGTQTSGGRITWNFDQPGDNYFLNMGRLNDQELRVVGFQAHGKNTSTDPITEFSGVIRSDFTNEERPIYIMAQDPNAQTHPPLGPPQVMLPTLPEDTYGIPGLADFDISSFGKPINEIGKDGEPLSEFLRIFGPFTLVLKYDGATIERHFTLEQIKAQVALLEKQSRPFDSSVPRVTRKPTAPAVQALPLFLPPQSPPPTVLPPSPPPPDTTATTPKD